MGISGQVFSVFMSLVAHCFGRIEFRVFYLAHVIEQPIYRIPNILFVYSLNGFFEARLERVIDGTADC